MQISKTLLTIGAVVICAGTVSQAAPDSEAQAKAREALHKKMAELGAQPVSEAPVAPAPAAAAPKPKASVPPPVAQPQPKPAPTSAGPNSEAQAKAREALRKKMAELATQPVSEAPAAGANASGFADPVQAANSPHATPEQLDRSRESVRQKIIELDAQAKAAAAVKVPASHPAPAALAFDPIPAPPSPLPASKEARLAELLKQYQADTLTPEQYHKERAKILAEP